MRFDVVTGLPEAAHAGDLDLVTNLLDAKAAVDEVCLFSHFKPFLPTRTVGWVNLVSCE